MKRNNNKMIKILTVIKSYWWIPFTAAVAVFIWKKKKTKVENPDEDANNALNSKGIKERAAQDVYKAYALQIAEGLGTAYSKFDPRHWWEKDESVYELMAKFTRNDFEIVSKLYFEVYAKGRSLSEDLAKYLDKKYYSLLKVK